MEIKPNIVLGKQNKEKESLAPNIGFKHPTAYKRNRQVVFLLLFIEFSKNLLYRIGIYCIYHIYIYKVKKTKLFEF